MLAEDVFGKLLPHPASATEAPNGDVIVLMKEEALAGYADVRTFRRGNYGHAGQARALQGRFGDANVLSIAQIENQCLRFAYARWAGL